MNNLNIRKVLIAQVIIDDFMLDEELTNYLNSIIHKRSYSSYNGIIKRAHPKWVGWKYIDKIKKYNVQLCDEPQDEKSMYFLKILDTMSDNFYIIKFLENKFRG